MNTADIPEPWLTAMVAAGMVDPRYADDRPSLRRLAAAAGMHTTTVSRMVKGTAGSRPEHVAAVADALGVDVRIVSEWTRQARTEVDPYEPPAEVNLLTRRQQDAITEMIRAIAARPEGAEEHARSAANAQAGVSPALEMDDVKPEDMPPLGGEASPGLVRPRRGRGRNGREQHDDR